MWHRQIHLPLRREALLEHLQQRGGLRVVDHDDVVVVGQLGGVRVHPLPVGLAHLVVQMRLGALQRVVDRLGDVEEPVGTLDHDPRRLDAEVVHERDLRLEQLGDAAAVGGAADVQDPAGPGAGAPRLGGDRGPPRPPPPRTPTRAWVGSGRSGASLESTWGRAGRPDRSGAELRELSLPAVGALEGGHRAGPARRSRPGRPGRRASSGTRCTRRANPPDGLRAASWP